MESRLPDWIAYKEDNDELSYKFCQIVEQNTSTITFILSKDSPKITIPWHRVLKVKRGGAE